MKKIMRILVMTMIVALLLPFEASAAQTSFMISEKGSVIHTPLSYKVSKVFSSLGDEGYLNQADDIFIDEKDMIYIADTGNNRIVKLDQNGEVTGSYTGPDNMPFSSPRGIFADSRGEMYVADTNNNRIVHLSADGAYIEEFVSPESELLGKGFTLQPTRVYVSNTGYIYVMKNHTFLSMDADNMFRGYVGAPAVGFSFTRALIKLFASKEQKSQIARVNPYSYTNFIIADDGMIYATLGGKTGQIKKINATGTNVYKEKFFGERFNDGGVVSIPYFIDLAVDKSGIISALDNNTGRIFQYDQEGNLLTAFSGKGSIKGYSDNPSSIACDSQGRIYVLDSGRNNIQVFEPTKFIKLVHSAVKLYGDGKYSEAKDVWLQVMDLSETYFLAHRGLGKVYFKEGKWVEAMKEYRLAENQLEYARAFTEYRSELFRGYFGWVALGCILCLYLIYKAILVFKDLAAGILNRHSRWL